MRPLATLASARHADPTRRRERPALPVPAWPLLPGLLFLAASLAVYYQYQRHFPAVPLDLEVYRGGLAAYRDGAAVYRADYGQIHMPFTYPPAALVLFYPLGLASLTATQVTLTALGFAATYLVAWAVTGMLGYRGTAGRIGIAAAFTGLALWLEPFQRSADFGQINAILLGLVVVDLALLRRTRFAGAGIGVAAAIKLVPAVFVLYLLLSRRFRAAATAVGTFLVISVAGVAAVPHSAEFWLSGLFIRGDRVTGGNGPDSSGNQSLRGFFARLLDEPSSTASLALWVISVVVVGVLGLALAVRAERRGEDAAAMCLVALTALLVSPVSWTHHWVWVLPFLMVLADAVLRLRGPVQTLAAAVPALLAAAFAVWPTQMTDDGPLKAHGIIWVAHRHGGLGYHLGLQLYVYAGLAVLALAALWLWSDRPAVTEQSVPAVPAQRVPVAVPGLTRTAARTEPETLTVRRE
ncbi:glycosyltransferase 87 family protein [Catenuloplanes sp. NPDC051500]|uniref:glycosyltransferase 87 family protein n=1 Tax=Catenuloplanes sp. NPDC051500 TaxID=3363959 RepID=UPI003796EB13